MLPWSSESGIAGRYSPPPPNSGAAHDEVVLHAGLVDLDLFCRHVKLGL